MKYADLSGRFWEEENKQDAFLGKLYGSVWGRAILRPLVCPFVSRMAGRLLDSRISRLLIRPFIRANQISMEQYEQKAYRSYNDFFTRRVLPGQRTFPESPEKLGAPCDGKVTAYEIGPSSGFTVTHRTYTLESLLRSRRLAEKYQGGLAVILRLTVDDYHRYAYLDDGRKTCNRRIQGKLHTVNPAADEFYPVYKENSREYTMLRTRNFGDVIQMEVGALLVGRIVNLQEKGEIQRGQEKGFFEFGGSTVILLFEKGAVCLKKELLENTERGCETVVKMGEEIGWRAE